MKLGTLMYNDESSQKQHYKCVNNNKQTKVVNGSCAYNLFVFGPLTMKLCTLMYNDKSS